MTVVWLVVTRGNQPSTFRSMVRQSRILALLIVGPEAEGRPIQARTGTGTMMTIVIKRETTVVAALVSGTMVVWKGSQEVVVVPGDTGPVTGLRCVVEDFSNDLAQVRALSAPPSSSVLVFQLFTTLSASSSSTHSNGSTCIIAFLLCRIFPTSADRVFRIAFSAMCPHL